MAAANTDKFKKLARKWTGQVGAGGVADAVVTTIPLTSATNLPTDTAVVATIDRVDANGTATAAYEESVIGVVSGNNLVSCVRGAEGTAQAHVAGAVVEILVSNKAWGDVIDGILAEHGQDGTHDATKVAMLAGVQTITGVKSFSATPKTDAIAEVTGGAGVTVDGLLIKDAQVQLPAGPYTAATDDTTVTFALATSRNQTVTLGGNRTLALSGATTGMVFIISLLQDGTGSRTVTWWDTIRWAGGSAPTLTTTASKRDTFGFICTGEDTYDGFIVGQNV